MYMKGASGLHRTCCTPSHTESPHKEASVRPPAAPQASGSLHRDYHAAGLKPDQGRCTSDRLHLSLQNKSKQANVTWWTLTYTAEC